MEYLRKMSQRQSLLFRLPRELRDEIYSHYIRDQHGYIFNSRSNTIRTLGGQPPDLALGYTCKRLAEEVGGMAFKLNTITFRTFLAPPDGIDLCSTAL